MYQPVPDTSKYVRIRACKNTNVSPNDCLRENTSKPGDLKKKKIPVFAEDFFSLFDKSLGGRFNPRSKVMIDWCGRIGELGL